MNPLLLSMLFIGEDVGSLGLSGAFNTFRRGSKWFEALHVNDEIELVVTASPDDEMSVEATSAIVTGVDLGPLDAMLAQYAARNHAIVRGRADLPDHVDSALSLRTILTKIYGPLDYDEEMTVVHLARPSWTPIKGTQHG